MNTKLLYFSAEWCGPCSTQSPIVKDVQKNYEDKDVDVLKIDIDENQEMGQAFQVRSLPTVMVVQEYEEDEDDEEVVIHNRYTGVTQQDVIESALDEVLDSEE